MNDEDQTIESEKELEFDEQDLEIVEISDDAITATDKSTKQARRRAKKEAKKHLTHEEKKRARRKKDLIALGIMVFVLVVLLAVPITRWPFLNAIGFRSDVSTVVQEQGSNEPLANVLVTLDDGSSATTDEFGRATLKQAKLGKQKISVKKTGYGAVVQEFTNSIGNTKLSDLKLKVVGIKLDVVIKDWLSGRVLSGAVVTYEEANAQSDATGLASIVIPPTDQTKVKLLVSANGYIAKTVETEVSITSREVSLIASSKNYFISKRDGKFDIYSSNLDGTQQKKIIEGTAKETEGLIQFTIHRNNKQAILVANRDGTVQNNRIIAGVYVVDLEKSTLKKIDEGSDIQILDWTDDSLAYTKTSANLKYDDPNFTTLQSYNLAKPRLTQISQANYFQVLLGAQGKVFYVPADSYRSIENSVLTSYDVNTGGRRTYIPEKRISYATRSNYDTLDFQDSEGKNYQLNISSGVIKNVDRQPGSDLNFALRPSGGQVVWTDRRDGQGALLSKSVSTNDERIVARIGGMTYPVRYITESLVIVRVATSQETADYVVDLASGEMAKIVDVSNIGSNRSSVL